MMLKFIGSLVVIWLIRQFLKWIVYAVLKVVTFLKSKEKPGKEGLLVRWLFIGFFIPFLIGAITSFRMRGYKEPEFIVCSILSVICLWGFFDVKRQAILTTGRYYQEWDDHFETKSNWMHKKVSIAFEDVIVLEKSVNPGALWVLSKDGQRAEVYVENFKTPIFNAYFHQLLQTNPSKIRYEKSKGHAAILFHHLLQKPDVKQDYFIGKIG